MDDSEINNKNKLDFTLLGLLPHQLENPLPFIPLKKPFLNPITGKNAKLLDIDEWLDKNKTKQKKEFTPIKTPSEVKDFFKDYIFPCKQDKSPDCYSWKEWTGDIEKITSAGLNCGKANIVVVDIDSYKENFNDKAKQIHEIIKKNSQFFYQTPRGGHHYFFKQPATTIGCPKPVTGIDIKGAGGYVCLYGMPFHLAAKYETFDEFYKDLPEFNPEWAKKQPNLTKQPSVDTFKKGDINPLIAKRAGRAAAKKDFKQVAKDIIEMHKANPDTFPEHIKDYGKKLADSLNYCHRKEINFQKPIHNILETETDILQTEQITEKDIQKPVAFIKDFLLDNDFNFVGGQTKLGKSRGVFVLAADRLKELDKTGLILSTENDLNTMIAPLLKVMKALNKFQLIKDNVIKMFPPNDKTAANKILTFTDRIKKILEKNSKVKCVIIDPLPRFFDWNQEQFVTNLVDNLRKLAKESNTCIIGIRNDGKTKEYQDVHKTKGSSALVDIARQIIRTIPCHKKSSLGKEFKKEKLFVMLVERSSLFKKIAILFKMKIEETKTAKGETLEVAVPVKIKILEDDMDKVKYLCDRKSGQTLSSKITYFIKSKNTGGCTLDELYSEFEDFYDEKTIRDTVYRNFDHKKHGGITYIHLIKQK